jgi:hypothetical protein
LIVVARRRAHVHRSLAEEAARDIVIEDVALALAIFATRDSGVICASGDPFWPRFRVAYPPASL